MSERERELSMCGGADAVTLGAGTSALCEGKRVRAQSYRFKRVLKLVCTLAVEMREECVSRWWLSLCFIRGMKPWC